MAKPAAKKVAPVVRNLAARNKAGKFDKVLTLIAAARQRAYQAVNTELVGLYWKLAGTISRKIASAELGDGVVDELAETIADEYQGQRGFTRAHLFRMRQFFEAYRNDKKVAPLVRQLPWTHQQTLTLSPTLVAEYQTALPSKALLRRKLHELYAQFASED